jgi:hypothetical protein
LREDESSVHFEEVCSEDSGVVTSDATFEFDETGEMGLRRTWEEGIF